MCHLRVPVPAFHGVLAEATRPFNNLHRTWTIVPGTLRVLGTSGKGRHGAGLHGAYTLEVVSDGDKCAKNRDRGNWWGAGLLRGG